MPVALRGTHSGAKLVHVCDWYATFSVLAGVDPGNPVDFNGTTHDIDGVDVGPWAPECGGRNGLPPPGKE